MTETISEETQAFEIIVKEINITGASQISSMSSRKSQIKI